MPLCLETNLPEDLRLWRYMDIGRFLVLLQRSALYFSRIDCLDDKWEGYRTASATKEFDGSWTKEYPVHQVILDSFDRSLHRSFVNCWHRNERESAAMWKLYVSGNEGVAIQTTVGRLTEAIQTELCRVWLAAVTYGDHAVDTPSRTFTALEVLTFKRSCHAHEQEVRAVIVDPTERLLKIDRADVSFAALCVPADSPGMEVSVDLSVLIERIVLSPNYQPWAISALQEIVSRAGLTIRLDPSDVLRPPPSERLF